MRGVKLGDLLSRKVEEWHLALLAGEKGLESRIEKQDVHRPGIFLAGFGEFFPRKRLQVIGQTEIAFLSGLEPGDRARALSDFFARGIPGVFITRGLLAPAELVAEADRTGTPVIATALSTTRFVHLLTDYLGFHLAPQKSIHGTLVDVGGVGVLLTGEAGAGKSECALCLIRRGHSLIADDVVKVICYPEGHLQGTFAGPAELRGFMEIRGLGMIDIASMFGAIAVKDVKEINLGVELRGRPKQGDPGFDPDVQITEMLGVRIPNVRYPMIPGRDIATIVEVLAANYALRDRGVDGAEVFGTRLKNLLRGK